MLQLIVEKKSDGINGSYKTYLRKMCMMGTEESNNESMRMNAPPMICDNNKKIKSNCFS